MPNRVLRAVSRQRAFEFVENCPWSHFDIAGMAWSSKDSPTVPKGGTGGVLAQSASEIKL